MIRKDAHVIWRGTGKEGKGEITTESKALQSIPYGFGSRFEKSPGTNPEELIGAAHAGCFSMALAFKLSEEGFNPKELKTDASVFMEKETDGWAIKQVRLTVKASIPEITERRFQEIADHAKKNCPVSKLLNAKIDLEASLLSSSI